MSDISIVTWNVNSVRARLEHVDEFLKGVSPDIVLLQETKVVADQFPREPIEDLGYNIEVVGEKSYNGVAILSKFPIEDVNYKLPGDREDTQARYIEAFTGGVRVASVYVPNGDTVDSPKYPYKLNFLKRLYDHAKTLLQYEEPLVIGGDYNIAPDVQDVPDPKKWAKSVLHTPEVRQLYRSFMHTLGMVDAVRFLNPESSHDFTELATWWDYRSRAYEAGTGLRIDHLLLSPEAADRLTGTTIEKDLRGKPKASDHAPVSCTLKS